MSYFNYVQPLNNVLKGCELSVEKAVNKLGIKNGLYAHNPQTIFSEVLNKNLYTFLCAGYTHFLHKYFMRFSSVYTKLYALSTGPTITTTLINNKKGL
jgi:hypothetical protein